MSKRIFALLAAVAVASVLLVVFCPDAAYAYEQTVGDDDFKNSESYAFLQEFVTACPDRSSNSKNGVTNEKAAAEWLKAKFDALLPSRSPAAVDEVDYYEETAYNVSCKLDNPDTDKQIIFGAHYDSINGQGAGDNAFGIATLYMLFKAFVEQGVEAPYDLVFVAFGGEERGLVGSFGYVQKMSETDKKNTVLMFNIDSIAFGDELYLHCENKHTDIADFLTDKIDGIDEKPYYKGIVSSGIDSYGYGYYETAQDSDHTPFRLVGIPVAFVFSGNYDGFVYKESADSDRCVMNTSADNLTKFDALAGKQAVARSSAIVSGILSAVCDEKFVSVCDNAVGQLVNLDVAYSALYPKIAALILVVVCLCCAIPYFRKLQKRAVTGNADIKSARVFTRPDAEDIFTFDEK